MSYQDWLDEPAWYVELLLGHLEAEAVASHGATADGGSSPDTLAEWR